MRYLLLRLKRFCGYIAGFIFFVSGILKLMDPVGAGLVMDEYYKFLHLGFMGFSSKFMGFMFALAETVIGTALITGVWRRLTAKSSIILQGFFTTLTLLLVIFNPDMDCGCFGEAIHLTHAQTFLKNIVLLALLLANALPLRHLGQPQRKKYVSFALVTTSVAVFCLYSLTHIPLVDFTAYKTGADLLSSASVDTDDMYESIFTYEKDGEKRAFTLDELPDSTWTFVGTETIEKDNTDNLLIELSFYNAETGTYADSLATEGKVMVISVYDTDISDRRWRKLENFISHAREAGFHPLLLCADPEGIPTSLYDKAYISGYKTLISMNRSNCGVTYFSDGTLIKKWAFSNMPDMKELSNLYKDDTTEIEMSYESKGSLALQGFLLYVFAIMLLL